MPRRRRERAHRIALQTRDLRHDASIHLDAGVPGPEGRLELGQLVAPLREPDRLRGLGQDAVLVPRDVPGDGDDDLAVHAREQHDARVWLAEALADSAHRTAVRARVEELGRLDHRALLVGEPAQDRLGRKRVVGRRTSRVEERAEAEATLAWLLVESRRRGASFLDPAVLGCDLLTQRADVEEVLTLGGKAHRSLPE